MSIAEQVAATMQAFNADTDHGIGEDATHTTEDGETVTEDLRATVVRQLPNDEQILGMDASMGIADATAVVDDWPAVQAGDVIGLADGNWQVQGDAVAVSGLLLFRLARSRVR